MRCARQPQPAPALTRSRAGRCPQTRAWGDTGGSAAAVEACGTSEGQAAQPAPRLVRRQCTPPAARGTARHPAPPAPAHAGTSAGFGSAWASSLQSCPPRPPCPLRLPTWPPHAPGSLLGVQSMAALEARAVPRRVPPRACMLINKCERVSARPAHRNSEGTHALVAYVSRPASLPPSGLVSRPPCHAFRPPDQLPIHPPPRVPSAFDPCPVPPPV